MKFRKKPVVIEAITFAELAEYGKANGANIVNGMPWSFSYAGQPISHENDSCYLIPTLEGIMRMGPGDMLITGVKGEIYPCRGDIFEATYEAVEDHSHTTTLLPGGHGAATDLDRRVTELERRMRIVEMSVDLGRAST
jgi:hypothetical protein